mgnify:CR=1 FL=1
MLISNYRAAQSTIDSYAGVDRPRDSGESNKRLASTGCASQRVLDSLRSLGMTRRDSLEMALGFAIAILSVGGG